MEFLRLISKAILQVVLSVILSVVLPVLLSVVFSVIVITGFVGCGSKKATDSARVTLSFPKIDAKTAQSKSESAAASYDFSLACFAISVTASDITPSGGGTCDIAVGIFYGFAAPGTSVSLVVPSGSARKMEVFAYRRTSLSETCPTGKTNLKDLEIERLSRVGVISSFDVSPPEVSVNITLTEPSGNVVSQYSLPTSCLPVSAPPPTATPTADRPRTSTAGLAAGGKQTLSTSSGYRGEISVGQSSSHFRFDHQVAKIVLSTKNRIR